MSLQEFEDCDQHKFRLWVQDGHFFPTVLANNPHHLKELKNWETRGDDVLVCTFPRSGTFWLWEIVSLLISNQTDISDSVFGTSNLELNGTEKLDELPSPRVLQSHMVPSFLPKVLLQKQTKIVYGIRNPKDVAVSIYAFMCKLNDCWSSYQGPWENFLTLFQNGTLGYGSWFEHVRSWEKLCIDHNKYPVLFVFYEDLHKDCFKEVKKIADFLELDTSDDTIHNIVQSVQFENFRAQKLKSVGHKLKALSKDGQDPFFRKGIVGDWKNKFTNEQIEAFDRVMEDKKEDSQIIRRYLKY